MIDCDDCKCNHNDMFFKLKQLVTKKNSNKLIIKKTKFKKTKMLMEK